MRSRLLVAFVCLVAFGTLASCGGADNAVDMVLRVDPTVVRDGDPIDLTVEFRAREDTKVYFGERPSETMRIFLRGGDGTLADNADSACWWPSKIPLFAETGIPVALHAGETHTVQIEGVVSINRVTGETEFDLGNFGTIAKDSGYRSFLVGVGFWPSRRGSMELLDHFSNDVWIDLER